MQGQLSRDQWVQLEEQVRAWESAARAALEATCGHYTRCEHLLPLLKFRPRGVPAPHSGQRACVAVMAQREAAPTADAGVSEAASAAGSSAGAAAPESTLECAQPGGHPRAETVAAGCREGRGHGAAPVTTQDGGEMGCFGDAAARGCERAEDLGVAVRVCASVRVFLVAQEPVGRLPGRVWVRLDPGAPCPSPLPLHLMLVSGSVLYSCLLLRDDTSIGAGYCICMLALRGFTPSER